MLEKHLRGSGFEYLGMPYWDWTRSTAVPDLFDNIEFPTAVDRMLEIRHVFNISKLILGTRDIINLQLIEEMTP